jgi:hypothetical protein
MGWSRCSPGPSPSLSFLQSSSSVQIQRWPPVAAVFLHRGYLRTDNASLTPEGVSSATASPHEWRPGPTPSALTGVGSRWHCPRRSSAGSHDEGRDWARAGGVSPRTAAVSGAAGGTAPGRNQRRLDSERAPERHGNNHGRHQSKRCAVGPRQQKVVLPHIWCSRPTPALEWALRPYNKQGWYASRKGSTPQHQKCGRTQKVSDALTEKG